VLLEKRKLSLCGVFALLCCEGTMGCAGSKQNGVQPINGGSKGPALILPDFKVREEGVGVLIRVRGLNAKEKSEEATQFMQLQSETQVRVPTSKLTPTEHTFAYDAVLGEQTSQTQVYALCGAKVISTALSGCNATLFAYGQTGKLRV
jgi:Kinesin motor domain